MARTTEEYSSTPFARMLTAYMWSQTPPWSTTKLATVLGISRIRVGRWIYHDIVPELNTLLAIMARLGIPLSRLMDAYVEIGLPVPPLTEDAARLMSQQSPSRLPPVQQPPQQPQTQLWPNAEVTIPTSRQGNSTSAAAARAARAARSERAAEVTEVADQQGGPAAPNAALNYEHAEPAQRTGENTEAEWETMIAHTRKVMTAAGMDEPTIEEMLQHIRAKPTNRTSSARTARQDSGQERNAPDNQPRESSKRR